MPRWTYPDGATKHVSGEEFDRLMEEQGEAYSAAVDRATEAQRRQYEFMFGPEYRAKHPFVPNSKQIHALACKEVCRTTVE